MTDAPPIPSGFAVAEPKVIDRAKSIVWDVLSSPVTVDLLRAYYDPSGDYAGATFVWAQPVDHESFTAADLFAITLLSVDPPAPRVARQILGFARKKHDLDTLLRSEHLGEDVDLAYADAATFAAMADLYNAVKQTLGHNPWVTASKLCARKRPRLFPVRDALVCGLLDLTRHRNYEIDWQVFQAIAADHEIMTRLDAVRAEAASSAQIDPFPLRWLDVALWMHARQAHH